MIDRLKKAILSSLSPELLKKTYRDQLKESDPAEKGHCAVATEAFYYLAGGAVAGFMPVACGYNVDAQGNIHFGPSRPDMRRESHWWLRGPKQGQRGAGEIIDITARQFSVPFSYDKGRNTGFMQPQRIPSQRAQIVMNRVIEKLGMVALEEFRRSNIKAFSAAASHHPSGKKLPAAPRPRL